VIYSTYMGGTVGYTSMNAVTADAAGNAYVTGETFATDYPRTPGLPAANVGGPGPGSVSAAFFAKISPAGDEILYAGGIGATSRTCSCCSSCFLSTLSTAGLSIALDPAGNAYIAGNTNGTGLPATTGAFLTNGTGAFVARVNAAGTALDYLTYLDKLPAGYIPAGGTAAPTIAYAMVVDAIGNVYISGDTSNAGFPATASAFQRTLAGSARPGSLPPDDAFVAKLNPTGTALVWATFLGGSASDAAHTVAVDAAADVWVSGITQSSNFPVSAGFPGGAEFLAEFDSAGSSLLYGTRFPADTVAAALAVDSGGTVHAAGDTGLLSTISPAQSVQPEAFGIGNAAGSPLSGRIAPFELISIYGLKLGPTTPISATFNSNGFLPTTLAGVQVTINGSPAPLLYVSSTQINAVVPGEVAAGQPGYLSVTSDQTSLPPFRVLVDSGEPAVFLRPDGTAALNQDGTFNTLANPAPPGSIVSIWATGAGGIPGLADGQMATAAQNTYCCVIQLLSSTQEIPVAYAGAAPGMVNGIIQVNFQIPGPGTYYYFSLNSSAAFPVFVGTPSE
jgi:uncharacterized protein (TIGR03437 family)